MPNGKQSALKTKWKEWMFNFGDSKKKKKKKHI